jgi:glycosyltransferase involved in cell wall biosynthesis
MKVNVCIVTFPSSEAGYVPLSNLARIFSKLSNRVCVVSGGAASERLENLDVNVRTMRVTRRVSSKLLIRIINYLHTQLEILRCVVAASGGADLFAFSIGGEGLILPVLVLKLLGKKVLLIPGGIATKGYSARKDPLTKFVSLLTSINAGLADRLILYSSRLIQEGKFARYQSKIIIAHEHFIDFSKFAVKKKINDRSAIVGYIGRFSEEKGVLDLMNAIVLVLKQRKDVSFMLCGMGNLSDEIRGFIRDEDVEAYVRFRGWIPHDDVPQYLNELKLVILPSVTEGLPNILLEAMACGTPTLATSVGGIPDVVIEGKTGFLLKSTGPEHIAERIIELFAHPCLMEKVSEDAYTFVREKFSYEKTLELWRGVLEELYECTND